MISFEGEQEERIGRTAWCGDIDITGKRRPISYFREIVYGLRRAPYIAVENPANYGKKQIKSKWAFEDNLPSWTWKGHEGNNIVIDIYSPSDEVELFVNGKSLGRKTAGEEQNFTAKYETKYEPGILMVKAYEHGEELYTEILTTAQEPVRLTAESDRTELRANGEDIAFITVELNDQNGIVNMQEEKEIFVEIDGPGSIQGFGNADAYFQGSYQRNSVYTFEGRVQAAVRAGVNIGEIRVRFSAAGCENVEIILPVRKAEKGKEQ